MAVNGHDDKFVLNDITFSVPPLEIRIDKEAANFSWQTLRTRNAQHVKSGHGIINISFNAVFIGAEAINNQLRPLIAQLKLTPICYAENTFLRHSIFPDKDPENEAPVIALILKSLTITAQAELKDTLVAHFQFSWFNYEPYCDDLRFKTDILVPEPQSTPEKSIAWQKFYLAEMGELGGKKGTKYIPVDELNSSLTLLYNLLAIDRDDFNKGRDYKKTDIKYETSNVRKDGLTLFIAEDKVDCLPENQLIVTGVTVVFENIVAALPVIGHQYMTYQHIGSIDPRVIIRIMALSDDARLRIASAWKTVEQNAIKFRHVPQEFLNIVISNQVTRLCGLKTFITETIVEETVPGQPGTYALTMELKGTDYPRVKEQITSEFVTLREFREATAKFFNKFVTTVAAGDQAPFAGWRGESLRGTGQSLRIAPSVKNTPESALFYSLCKEWADRVDSTAQSIASNITGSSGATALARKQEFINKLQRVGPELTGPIIDAIQPVAVVSVRIEPTSSSFDAFDTSTSFPILTINRENRVSDTALLENPSNLDELARQNTIIPEVVDDLLGTFLASFSDRISLDGSLDLPQLKELKALADKMGIFQGKSAYPDFPVLQSIAETEGINPLSLNPDFYFYSPVADTMEKMIDPGYLQAAEEAARTLYVNEGSTGSQVGDFINVLNNHVEETFKNRFAPDSSIRKSIDESKARISRFFSPGRTEYSQSNMRRESVGGLKYNNALSGPRPLAMSKFGADPVNTILNEGTETVCVSTGSLEHHGDFKAVLDNAPQTYTPAEIKSLQVFTNPIGPGAEVKSRFGLRNVENNPEASKNHKGIDIRAKTSTNVLASAPGIVRRAKLENPKNDKQGWGQFVEIIHPNGYLTRYAHLSEMLVKQGDKIDAGQVIGRSGGDKTTFGSGNSRDPHLHFEVVDHSGHQIDPEKALAGSIFSRDASAGEGFQFGNSIFARSLESIQNDMLLGQGPSMKRAYPTFKLYFMEEDVEDRIFGFDDFFSYNSVKSIRVVRSRKVPADLCVIELTNVSGILSNRKFRNEFNQKGEFVGNKPRNQAGEILQEDKNSPLLNDTSLENPIASLMLQEGIKILLKLGYDNDPSRLEDVFVGQIVEVEFNDTDDLVTIVCQSYTTELTQQIKGLDKPEERGGWFLGTNNAVTTRLLSEMLQQPEVLHFGRWKRSRGYGVRFGILSTDRGSNTNLDILSNRYEWNVTPQDDNIFAPVVNSDNFASYFNEENATKTFFTSVANFMIDVVGLPQGFNLNFINYYIDKMTIWDIFKEMELRHPGCIASPVPYMDSRLGPRMTMFFGLPNQLYFARDPSKKEQRRNQILTKTVLDNEAEFTNEYNMMSDLHGTRRTDNPVDVFNERVEGVKKIFSPLNFINPFGTLNAVNGATQAIDPRHSIRVRQREAYNKHLRKNLAISDRSIRPFRSYHVLTSNNHIIQNNIRASSLDMYNTVSIEYTVPNSILGANFIGKKPSGGKEIFRLKADAGLPDEEVQEVFLQYPSCEGETMAEFYALGALKLTLRDIYKGEIVTIGIPTVKPYDICYIFDEYTDMIGPVEVEQVVHYFSQETGFITEITPDICITVNEWTTLGTTDIIGLTIENWIDLVFRRQGRETETGNIGDGKAVNLGVTIPVVRGADVAKGAITAGTGGVQLLGAFVSSKLVHWSKYRHPITFSPLLHKGRPFMAGMASKTINANWWTNLKQWFKEGVDGVPLVFNDIGDKLVIGAGTGRLSNLGVSTVNTSFR